MANSRHRSLASRLSIRARWTWRRLERGLPDWMRRTLPMASSLLFHVAVLLIMALAIRFVNDGNQKKPHAFDPVIGQLTDDVTSLNDAEVAGDSFTSIETDEPPSLPPDLSKSDESMTAVAELPDTVKLGPELNLNPSVEPGEVGAATADAGASGGPAGTPGGGPSPTSPLFGRSAAERAKLVRREGGTVESELAVERGLDWIARHQRDDGGWSLDTNVSCTPPGCPPRPAMESDTAATGLALLPLLAAGHTHTQKGRYQLTIRHGLGFLLNAQQPDGLIYLGGTGNSMMYSHCIATMAICESYGLTRDKRLRLPAEMAVGYLARSQHALGGWRYQPMQEGDTSVFGWAIFALRSANIAGINIPRANIKGASRYLDSVAADPKKSTYGYLMDRPATITMTTEGLVCRQILGWEREYQPLVQGVDLVARDLEVNTSRNIYYWYYATQLLHNMRDKNWLAWNERVREGLISMQRKGNGCDRGSWDPQSPQPDVWGTKAGRLYTTSLSLLTLEVYYRYLPLYRDQGGAISKDGEATDDTKAAEKKDADDKGAAGKASN